MDFRVLGEGGDFPRCAVWHTRESEPPTLAHWANHVPQPERFEDPVILSVGEDFSRSPAAKIQVGYVEPDCKLAGGHGFFHDFNQVLFGHGAPLRMASDL